MDFAQFLSNVGVPQKRSFSNLFKIASKKGALHQYFQIAFSANSRVCTHAVVVKIN